MDEILKIIPKANTEEFVSPCSFYYTFFFQVLREESTDLSTSKEKTHINQVPGGSIPCAPVLGAMLCSVFYTLTACDC